MRSSSCTQQTASKTSRDSVHLQLHTNRSLRRQRAGDGPEAYHEAVRFRNAENRSATECTVEEAAQQHSRTAYQVGPSAQGQRLGRQKRESTYSDEERVEDVQYRPFREAALATSSIVLANSKVQTDGQHLSRGRVRPIERSASPASARQNLSRP